MRPKAHLDADSRDSHRKRYDAKANQLEDDYTYNVEIPKRHGNSSKISDRSSSRIVSVGSSSTRNNATEDAVVIDLDALCPAIYTQMMMHPRRGSGQRLFVAECSSSRFHLKCTTELR